MLTNLLGLYHTDHTEKQSFLLLPHHYWLDKKSPLPYLNARLKQSTI
jgi:hypothetical protein